MRWFEKHCQGGYLAMPNCFSRSTDISLILVVQCSLLNLNGKTLCLSSIMQGGKDGMDYVMHDAGFFSESDSCVR